MIRNKINFMDVSYFNFDFIEVGSFMEFMIGGRLVIGFFFEVFGFCEFRLGGSY